MAPVLAVGCAGYFYPRSPCGERQQGQSLKIPAHRISIHALLAESDILRSQLPAPEPHFYPRSPCGERRDVIAEMTEAQSISIHALLAESDGQQEQHENEGDTFLSTLSLRRATH